MVQKLLMVLIICTVILQANSSYSQAISLEHNGVQGTWMPDDMAKKVLADVSELKIQRELVLKLQSNLDIRMERITALKEALVASESSEKRTMEAMGAAIQAKEDAEKKLHAWYRHPAFWAVIGCVLTVGLEVGSVKLVQALD
jgi:hypothetical protein